MHKLDTFLDEGSHTWYVPDGHVYVLSMKIQ